MKKFVLSLIFVLVLDHCQAQSWTYSQGGNAFDGKYKTCSIEGVGHTFPYLNPLFVINIFKGDINNPNIYLTKVPYGGCDNKEVLIKLDEDENIYQPSVTVSNTKEAWFLHFDSYESIKDSLKQIFIMYILPQNQNAKIRKEPNVNSQIIKELSSRDTLFLFNHDPLVGVWNCTYGRITGYVDDMYLPDLSINGKTVSKETYTPITKTIKTNKDMEQFFQDIKKHSVMHIRLLSDCVKSDFEFSLKGSTAALNFVFTK